VKELLTDLQKHMHTGGGIFGQCFISNAADGHSKPMSVAIQLCCYDVIDWLRHVGRIEFTGHSALACCMTVKDNVELDRELCKCKNLLTDAVEICFADPTSHIYLFRFDLMRWLLMRECAEAIAHILLKFESEPEACRTLIWTSIKSNSTFKLIDVLKHLSDTSILRLIGGYIGGDLELLGLIHLTFFEYKRGHTPSNPPERWCGRSAELTTQMLASLREQAAKEEWPGVLSMVQEVYDHLDLDL
jgi:hypothetical protein